MLIEKGELYTEKYSAGSFRVYLAIEDAESAGDIVKVVDLTRDANVYLTSDTVIPFEGELDVELRAVSNKYT
ncbi:hypothetical protein 8F11_83 [uncultured Caudovirales phage]|uniref:Uncharacterized protein n=1 Tax=uncultured Caudovirales phage TaxID=2100421 RepID=A0A2H4J731_9CAUD|nr:hypothetical protein 8F11_83 [uncultured Caudovirales phage]